MVEYNAWLTALVSFPQQKLVESNLSYSDGKITRLILADILYLWCPVYVLMRPPPMPPKKNEDSKYVCNCN